MPIAFAQVREDPLLDLQLLDRLGGQNLSGMMIASGGCTAAALVASGRLAHLHLVDVNPAQLALCRLKLQLLQMATPIERLQLLGHSFLSTEKRAAMLMERLQSLGLPADALGPPPMLAALGPDHAGRYELLFAQLRAAMPKCADEWPAVLSMSDNAKRSARVAPGTALGQALDTAFDRVMALPNLVHLFGAAATQNSREPFSRHFARRTRHALATLDTADNPYLWQLLQGRFPENTIYPWLNAAAPQNWPRIAESTGFIDAALRPFHNHFDFVHLSNVLDWLSPEEARETLELSLNALRPGGCVLIRQLNSTLDLPALGPRFEWLTDEAAAMHAQDRSFFYRSLHLGRKR
jgi:S-adenosylmethionine-diacylglycerol 3-amino-3-carboxypropyl transferase